jgi:diadenosine tetraphosphatase ApaH/serine/threonine PP2A family protein phosphatase
MRAIVVADVHANLDALDAVLGDAEALGPLDALWCLGDTVGYGAEPDACIERLRTYRHEAIAGNHDLAAIGAMSTADFNPHAAAAARWTAAHLNDESKAWLSGLPMVLTVAGEFTLVHGSLVDPVWEYLVFPEAALQHLRLQETPYGFVGHSHLPLAYAEGSEGDRSMLEHEAVLPLEATRFVANPGSVGQPRDGDPRAAYAIVDTDSRLVTFRRVEYDIAAAQRKIRDAGLPEVLAARLSLGR